MKQWWRNKWLRILFSWGISGGILAILIRQLIINWQEIPALELDIQWGYIILAGIGFLSVVTWWGVLWYSLLRDERYKIGLFSGIHVHYGAWLARYVPFLPGAVLGKIVGGQQFGISTSKLVIATGYEQILQIFAALVLGTSLTSAAWVFDYPSYILGIGIAMSIVITSIILHPRIFYPLTNYALQKVNKPPIQEKTLSFLQLGMYFVLYLAGHAVNGLSFFIFVNGILDVPVQDLFIYMGFFVFAGVMGVLAIFVPSGVGVREGVISTLLSQFFTFPLAIFISIGLRIMITSVDIVIAILWTLYRYRHFITGKRFLWFSIGLLVCVMGGVIIRYSGSYIDEYWHIIAGGELLESGQLAEIYQGEQYTRGRYVSFLAAGGQALFQESLIWMRIFPLVIMGITGVFLYKIGTYLNFSYWMMSLWLLVWALSPWLLFNHIYFRVYGWFELIFMAGLWVVLHLWEVSEKHWVWWVGGTVILGGLFYALSDDIGSSLPLLGIGIGILITWIGRERLYLQRRWRILIAGVCGGLVFLIPDVQNLIDEFFTRDFIFATDENYGDFFFQKNTLISFLAFLGSGMCLIYGNYQRRTLVIIGGVLVILHSLSSSDLQLIRVILYLLPLYYLLALVPIQWARDLPYGKLWSGAGMVVLLGGLAMSYPSFYLIDGPHIPGEIHYIDYARAYQVMRNECQGHTLYETSPTPFISHTFGVDTQPVIDVTHTLQSEDQFFQDQEGTYRVVSTGEKIITDPRSLDTPYCWIQRRPSLFRYLTHFDDPDQVYDFVNIRVQVKE